jgi:hypothetical protein
MTTAGNVHRVCVDLSKPLARSRRPVTTAGHPVVPPIVHASAGEHVILQTRDAQDGQVTPQTTGE